MKKFQRYIVPLTKFHCVNCHDSMQNFDQFLTRHMFYSLKQSSLLSSVKKNADFSGTVYIFYLHNCSQCFGNHVEKYNLFQSFAKITACYCLLRPWTTTYSALAQNLLECCFSRVMFEFRNLATMLFSFLENFLEIPGVHVEGEGVSFVCKWAAKNVMKLSAAESCNPWS